MVSGMKRYKQAREDSGSGCVFSAAKPTSLHLATYTVCVSFRIGVSCGGIQEKDTTKPNGKYTPWIYFLLQGASVRTVGKIII